MSASFSQAALDRIAECASSETFEPEASPVAAVLERYLNGNPVHGLEDRDLPDASDAEMDALFGEFARDTANEFYRFAGLLELAVRVGYVDLGGWNEIDALNRALISFLERESKSEKPTDLILVNALNARLEQHEWCVATRNDNAFFAFASFLHLTTCVRDDREALQFLHESTRTWSAGDDLPFLLTPRHFAEAVTFRTVSGLESKTVARGLAALRYLQWFAEILERAKHVDALAEDFVRQARWSHHTPAVQRRVSIWADRMSEWADSGVDREGEEAWEQFKQAVLLPIEHQLNRITPQAVQDMSIEVPSIAQANPPTIDELLLEGRTGAARKQARQHAEWCGQQMAGVEGDDLFVRGQELVLACEKLAEVGDVNTAAVIVAPFLNKLNTWAREKALLLLSRSRAAGSPVPSLATEQRAGIQEAPFSSAQPKQHSVGGDEGASFTAV